MTQNTNKDIEKIYDNGKQQVLLGDSIAAMRGIQRGTCDLIFADPPYNLQLQQNLERPEGGDVASVDEDWDRFSDLQAYDDFTRSWLIESKRLLKDDGSLWVIGSYHNIFRLGSILQDLGWWILNDIVWIKSNPMPNFRGRRFCNAHETLLWCAPSKDARYRFNYHSCKQQNEDRQMRSDWYLPICPRSERLLDKNGKRLHPTQKPEALLRRILLASTLPGDLVLDPFGGSGTTCAVARALGRKAIGIDQDETYCRAAAQRVDNMRELDQEVLQQTSEPRQEKRVPFGSLLENGVINAGDELESRENSSVRARVMVDGSLLVGEQVGSIHKLASHLNGGAAINGWHYWRTRKGQIPLDDLRRALRTSSSR